jgi:plastocyanin
MRRRYLPLAAVLGVAAAVLPAIAASETTPTISAYNEPGGYLRSWMPSTATVGLGGTVLFKNPYSTTNHGLKFTGGTAGAPLPSCTGLPSAAETELGAPSWEAKCTFSKSGTYTFVCTVHPEMTGTITVNPNGTTTTTTTTPTTTTTTTTTPTEPPASGPLIGGPSLRSSQRGGVVRGSLVISKAGAGDRLEIDVFAKSASLAKAKRPAIVRVGRFIRSSAPAGKVSFVVKLNARARNALKHRHRLALTVRITLTPFYGEPTKLTRSVVEHG